MDDAVVVVDPEAATGTGGIQLGSRYFLGEQLGRGAMGVVYDATTTDGQSLAIKLLRPELASDDKTVARFVQERQIFRRIEHPNVVRVDDLVAEGDQLGIAMEKVAGGDLRQRIEARSLAVKAAMGVAADIAAGLEAIHAADVVHRDLKPANILLAETGSGLQPKISDFGISRLVSEAMTRTSTTIGTPLYMAPEAADKRGADAPADLYSLGAIMFELLIGTAPFHEGGTFAVLRAHAQDAPPRIGGVPNELADLIDQMLTKEPSARPTAADVQRRLAAIIPTLDDHAHNPVAIEREGGGAAAGAAGPVGAGAVGAVGSAGLAGGPSDSAETVMVPDEDGLPGDPAENRVSLDGSGPAATPAPAPVPSASNPFAGPSESDSELELEPEPMPSSVPPRPELAAAGTGPRLLDRLSRRAGEVGLAVASLAAVVAVIAFVATRGDDDPGTAIGSGSVTETDDGSDSDNNTSVSGQQNDGDADPGGPGIFDSSGDDEGSEGDEGAGDDRPATTDAPSRDTSTTARRTTSTAGGSTTSAAPTSSTTAPSTTTTEATTTTAPTTTTTEPTTTTAPPAVPIQIVSGPTVNTVGSTSFHFNYSTNDVCGTGSFTVTDKATNTVKGSFTGQNICYGPLHGGFPGHSSFPGFNLEPGTTYRVSISVRGTASDGTRTAGSGTASTSFEVTTSG